MFYKFYVKKDERGLLFHKGDFVRIVDAGEYRLFDPLHRFSVEKFPLSKPLFEHRLATYLIKAEPELVAREFHSIMLGADQVGLRYENDVLAEVLPPNTHRLYWKGYIDIRHEALSFADDYAIAATLAAQLVAVSNTGVKPKLPGADAVFAVQVPQHHIAMIFADGKRVRALEAGLHAFWRFGRDLRAEFVDLRMQALEVAGQEILTRDKVSLRVNLTAGYRITDAELAFAKQAKPVDFLYRELQFGLRAAVGTRTLDELLENKGIIDDVVAAHIRQRATGFGMEIDSVGVKDIILPGDMKTILAKVVEAEKVAQANVIRRREETAATRSLLNTAQVMEKNPTALRLKELEALEKIAEKIDKISVFGGLDSVMKDLVKINV